MALVPREGLRPSEVYGASILIFVAVAIAATAAMAPCWFFGLLDEQGAECPQ